MKPTKIAVRSAHCAAFGTGVCWSAKNPYWNGHYPTKEAAIEAARKMKAERDKSSTRQQARVP